MVTNALGFLGLQPRCTSRQTRSRWRRARAARGYHPVAEPSPRAEEPRRRKSTPWAWRVWGCGRPWTRSPWSVV